MESMNVSKLKELVRHPFVWPGGYEVLFITNDGECLCHKCVRDNFRIILDSMVHDIDDGWKIIGYELDCNMDYMDEDSPVFCAHCNKNFVE